jgi:hypothetical protein
MPTIAPPPVLRPVSRATRAALRTTRRAATLVALAAIAAIASTAAPRAAAAQIALGQWYVFSFGATGTLAQSGTAGTPAPPWVVTSATGVRVRVTDAQAPGDAFALLDGGVLVGSTPFVPAVSGGCSASSGDACYGNPIMSRAAFDLAPGSHSLQIRVERSAFGGGSGFFRVDALDVPVSTVPEPATVALLGGALAALGAARRRRTRA